MNLIVGLLFLLLTAVVAVADIRIKTFQYGKYKIRLLYRSENITQSKIVLAAVNNTLNTVDFVSVASTGANVPTYTCRQVSQQRIIYGPIGCSGTGLVKADNCFADDVEVQRMRDILYRTWYLNKESSACSIEGGGGDIRLCPGPLRLAIDNKDAYLPKQVLGVRDFLASRMRFIECQTGPFAMSPCVVEIRMVLPAFTLNTDCENPVTNVSYNGSYTVFDTDPYPGMISQVFKAFEGPYVGLRLFLSRDTTLSTSFRIVLGTTPDSDQDFVYYFNSSLISQNYTNGPSPTFFLNWMDLIQNNTQYEMYGESSNCTATFYFPDRVGEYTLLAPDPVFSSNYSLYQLPSRYYTTRICNYQVCGRDTSGMLTNAYCDEGDVAGGDVVYTDPRYPHLPIYVPPNANLDFRFDCDEMYPAGESFYDLNGVLIQRMNIQSGRCFSPFLDPSLIRLEATPYQREIQCQKMGGFPYTRAKSYCSRPIIAPIRCKKGWIFFDQKCFYKFDPSSESKFSSVLDQGDEMCALLSKDAQAVSYVDSYLEIFLRDYFVYWKQNVQNVAAYRIPVPGSETCSCFTLADPTRQGECPCFESLFNDTNLIFPICFYQIVEYEPAYSFMSLSYETARLYTYGQEGPFYGGYRAQCRCFPGWTGLGCETPTCPLQDILVSYNASDFTTTGSSTLSFFRRCMAFGQGRCNNGNPRICECVPGFGPSASSISSFESLYQFNLFPCNCPASSATSGAFQIDAKVYGSQEVVYLPCNGIYNGQCVSSNGTAPGYCICTERPNILLGGYEPSFDGSACTSSVPIQTFLSQVKNGPITTAYCNHKGVSCPSGQTIEDEVGNRYNPRCYSDIDGSSIDGCVCDNGWGGDACTCPVPINYAYERILERTEDLNYIYVDMGFRYIIYFVRVKGCLGYNTVSLSNEIGRTDETIDCTFNSTTQYYDCPSEIGYQFVVLDQGRVLDYELCTIEAYQEQYLYCGANHTVNPYAARFFDIAAYRGFRKSLENQDMLVATYGCTNTDCMCNSNFTGPLCGVGVSSIRPETIEIDGVSSVVYGKTVCGRSTLNPNLLDSVASRGQPEGSTCVCNPISSVDPTGKLGVVTEYFTGRACECATGLNRVNNTVMICSGHGLCEEPSFPYGQCEVDLDMYARDALYTPYVEVTEGGNASEWDINTAIAISDTYFIFEWWQATMRPTLSPTQMPTLNPTNSPTNRPTTSHPTPNPTSPTKSPTTQKYIYIFGAPITSGEITYEVSSHCYSFRTGKCASSSPTDFFGILSKDVTIANMASYIDFNPSTPVYSSVSTVYLGSWDTMINSGPLVSMNTAGVATNTYWTGGLNGLPVSCPGVGDYAWGSSSALKSGIVGDPTSTTSTWLDNTSSTCDNYYRIICACLSNSLPPTKSPTLSPTMPTLSPTSPTSSPTAPTLSPTSPTLSPTTSNPTTLSPTSPTSSPTVPTPSPTAPTQSPTIADPGITLYLGPTSNGNRGDRATTTAACLAIKPVGLTCLTTPLMVSYSTSQLSDFPTIYGFSGATNVYGEGDPLGGKIGTWSTMFSGAGGTVLDRSLYTPVITGLTSLKYATGSTTTGTLSDNCNDWSSTTSPLRNSYGSTVTLYNTWLRVDSELCTNIRESVCMCIPSFTNAPTSPTPSPTAPTSSPTVPTSSPVTPTASPTHFDSGVVFYRGTLSDGNRGNRATTTAACLGVKPSSLSCTYTPMFISYTGDSVSDFPSTYGFSTNVNIYGDADRDGSRIGVWSTALSGAGGNVLERVIDDTTVSGIEAFGSNLATGSTSTGATTDNCNDWSGTADYFRRGRTGNLNTDWISYGIQLCTNTVYSLCLCVEPNQPTPAPTTLSPTLSPTKHPSSSPTRSPSVSPTWSPTQSPSMLVRTQVMYKLPAGGGITTYKSPYNVTYESPNNVPPVNLTIRTITDLEPIAWQPSTYRVWDYNTNTTSTYVLSDPCNPANPSHVPGTPILQTDGVYQCPTNIKCVLTTDCTDELAPANAFTSITSNFTAFPDLRACLCSYTEVSYPTGLSLFQTQEWLSVELFSGTLNLTKQKDPPQNVAGSLLCNNFVHRTINCQLMSSSASYPDQCSRQPIRCNYNSTIGRFFGGFYDQNPNYRYDLVDFSEWDEGLYRGVASLLNYLFYMDPITGQEADPFLEDGGLIWDNYYWLNISSTQLVLSTWRTDPTFYWYQAHVIQGDPYMYSDSNIPPPEVIGLPNQTTFDAYYSCMSQSLVWIGPDADPSCYPTTWANSSTLFGRMPGIDYYYNTTPGEQMLSATVEVLTTVDWAFGIEVYNSFGDLCGTVLNGPQIQTIGSSFVFICPNNSAYANSSANGVFRVRVIGPSDIYDLPETTLNRQFLYYPIDALYSLLDLGYYTSFLHTSLGLAFPFTDVVRRFIGALTSSFWPTRVRSNNVFDSLSTTPFFRVQYNYSIATQSSGIDIDSVIRNIYNQIVVNNTYPYNYPLAAVANRFITEPIDYQNPIHLAYLQKVYMNYLSIRRCGAEDVQCKTFNLGTCIIGTKPGTKQRWYNVGSGADYEFEGREGGCNCFSSYTKGFFSFPTSCQLCEIGYGPIDPTEFRNTILYNQLVTRVYPIGFIPSTSINASQFENDFICRMPFFADPILSSIATINVCSGHGIVSFEEEQLPTTTVKVFSGGYIARCSTLWLGGTKNYTFDQENTQTANALIYLSADSMLTVIGEPENYAIYLDGNVLCVLVFCTDTTENVPWMCTLSCEDETEHTVVCLNDLLYSPMSVEGISTSVADAFRLYVN